MLWLLLACGDDERSDDTSADSAADHCVEEAEVTWVNFGEGFFTTYCGACHSVSSTSRYGAPEGVDFDSPGQVRDWEERIRVRVLVDETMPVGGGVFPEDLELLETFLDCGL